MKTGWHLCLTSSLSLSFHEALPCLPAHEEIPLVSEGITCDANSS